MLLKQGIEKAKETGWYLKPLGVKDGKNYGVIIHQKHAILLDLKFWKALGKAEDWDTEEYISFSSEAEFRHHDFLINLWSGNNLEEAFDLATEL